MLIIFVLCVPIGDGGTPIAFGRDFLMIFYPYKTILSLLLSSLSTGKRMILGNGSSRANRN